LAQLSAQKYGKSRELDCSSIFVMSWMRTFELIIEPLWVSVFSVAESDLEQAGYFL
jgi:hypothetical protein